MKAQKPNSSVRAFPRKVIFDMAPRYGLYVDPTPRKAVYPTINGHFMKCPFKDSEHPYCVCSSNCPQFMLESFPHETSKEDRIITFKCALSGEFSEHTVAEINNKPIEEA